MRFSLTHKGQLKKQMLIFNEQIVFDNAWNVNTPKDEAVLSLNLDVPGRPFSAHTPTEKLYHFLSTGKTKASLTMLVGLSSVKYKIDAEKFMAFFEVCSERMDADYNCITWFDILMLLFILQYLDKNSDHYKWARSHLSNIISKNKDVIPIINGLSSEKVYPII